MGQVTVFSGPERRQRWSQDERRKILEETFPAGACVTQVPRRHDVSTGLIYMWRRKMRAPVIELGFAEALVIDGGGVEGSAVIPHGARVWIAMGHTDMRKGMQGLALLVQQTSYLEATQNQRAPSGLNGCNDHTRRT